MSWGIRAASALGELQHYESEDSKRNAQPHHLAKSGRRYFPLCATDEARQGLFTIHLQGVDVPGRVLCNPVVSISLGAASMT